MKPLDINDETKKHTGCLTVSTQLRQLTVANLGVRMIIYCKPSDLKHLSIKWIAWRLGVSESYVTRCFKNIYEREPHKLLLSQKMKFACLMLIKKPQLSIKQISEKLDFSSVNYFINVFKKKMDLTPLQYRKWSLLNEWREARLRELAMDSYIFFK